MKRFPVLLIFITILIDLIGFGIVIPVLPYYVGREPFNATPFEIGWIFASFSIMQLICAPIFGRLSDRYGRRPILLFSMIGTAISFLILGFATTLWMVFLGRMLDGVTGANVSTAQAYIADITTPEERVKGMGLIGAAFGLGFVIGPMLGGLLSPYGLAVPFFFAAGLAIANSILLYFVLPETIKPGSHTATALSEGRFTRLLQYLGDARMSLLILIYFLVTVGFSIMTTAAIMFTAYRFGYTPRQNGLLFGFLGIIATIMQGGLIGLFTRKFGEARLTVAGTIMMAVSLFFIPLVGPQAGGLAALLAGIALFAVGQSFSTPTVLTLASKNVSPAEQGAVLGVMQSAASLARIIGPALTGILLTSAISSQISDFTVERTFWTATGVTLLAFVLATYFALRHRSPQDENPLTSTRPL